jgi:ankyrin repeat protein
MDRASFLATVEEGNLDAVKSALADDPFLASADASEPSAVLAALYRGHTEIVEILCQHAALTLAEASACGDRERVAKLLAEGGESVGGFTSDGWTPLHLAAFFGHAEVARALVAAAAPLDERATSRNPTANRPLHAALAGAEDEETIRCLLEAGALVDDRAGGGYTPLHLAASRGSASLVEMLLRRGADASARTDEGRTAADIALERGHAHVASQLEG